MLFNSLEFAVFFPIVTVLFFLLSQRYRWAMLLLASCAFYMAFIPAYILILVITILIDYFAGLWIERTEGARRKLLLVGSIISTCAVLFVFKYFNFFTQNLNGLTTLLGLGITVPHLDIILPIGLSFHTFQSLSYVIEVYRGHQKPIRHFGIYALYVMFYPQLVAGPIERPQNLLHQFWEEHSFDYDRVTSGLKRIAWGLFKKVVVADRLALYVNDVYAAPQNFNGLQLTLATLFFAYQIYCDFSGYSDIAIGTARVMGFKLMENFNTPYYSKSTSEFWRRWHVSLSTWFRDYVFIPLGGSRVVDLRKYANLLITFAVSGLWHGANWTYVIWGLLNGIYLVVGTATQGLRDRCFAWVGIKQDGAFRNAIRLGTTVGLTLVAWVVFRAKNMKDAGYILTHFWRGWDFGSIRTEQFLLRQLPVAVAAVAFCELIQLLHGRVRVPVLLRRLPLLPRWAVYAVFVFGIILFGVFRKAQFIYFQF